MPYLTTDQIEPSDVSDPATDGALLTAVETLVVDEVNLRAGSVGLGHLAATRAGTAAASNLPVTRWIDSIAPAGTSAHAAGGLGTVVSPGGTDLELIPIAGSRGTLGEGDVLRWHFSGVVDVVNDAGAPDDDLYTFYLEITGTDGNGAAVRTSLTREEFGIAADYSMNVAGLPIGDPAFGSNFRVQQQPVGFSFAYSHAEGDAVFSILGGDVHIDLIRVMCRVSDVLNSLVVHDCRLTAMIVGG
jgi:hypothetical protein